MHQFKTKTLSIVIFLFSLVYVSGLFAQEITPMGVKYQMQRVADWQIAHYDDTYSGKKQAHHPLDWTNGALYVGMAKWAAMANDDSHYEWLKTIGEKAQWKLHQRKYMADDHVVGQTYLELFREYGDSSMILPTKNHLDWIMKNPSQQPISLDNYKNEERWTWCDALFMAPPVWAKLSNITGNKTYSQWMLKEYKATVDHLFDSEENLFYRDNSYIGKKQHDRKVFWSRGNGWVFAGLTLLLDEYEEGSEEYKYFVQLYKKMAAQLIKIQTQDGHWSMSLLAADIYPTPEASGTSFFTFGLAWGINNGVLDNATYEPAVKKGWNALTSYITKDGMLGYVQPIGAAPGNALADKTEVFGSGAFLAAGSEVYKLYGGNPTFQIKKPDYERSPLTGVTREHWKDAAQYLLDGAFSYVNNLDDPLKFPKQHSHTYPQSEKSVATEKLEGLCRTLFLAAPLLKENPDLTSNGIRLQDYYKKNILNLITEGHPSYIKDIGKSWPGQNLVEFGALSIAFFVAPEILWDSMTQEQKDILAKKMIGYAHGGTLRSNWRFFNIFVLSFFKSKGYEVNEETLLSYLNKSLKHYREDGWYNDNPSYDYYSMWAFQMYGTIWCEVFGNEYYPNIAAQFRKNFAGIRNNYPNMFGKDGKMIMWGRSISYRFASTSPLTLTGLTPDAKVDWGWYRRISSGSMLQFLQHPLFLEDRVPTLGFYGPFKPSVQHYSCRGSVYWMGKAALALMVPADNPLWQAKETEGDWADYKKGEVNNKYLKGSNLMITDYANSGISEIRSRCKINIKESELDHYLGSANYNRLAFNSEFPWQADGPEGQVAMNFSLKSGDKKWDPGHLYKFDKYENGFYYRTLDFERDTASSMHLAEKPISDGILRVDQLHAKANFELHLGHYALPNVHGNIKREIIDIKGKKVQVINNGEYQLALVPVHGWTSSVTHYMEDLHPETKFSAVSNLGDTGYANETKTYVTLMLWKRAGERFTEDDLRKIKKVKVKEHDVKLLMSDKTEENIHF